MYEKTVFDLVDVFYESIKKDMLREGLLDRQSIEYIVESEKEHVRNKNHRRETD